MDVALDEAHEEEEDARTVEEGERVVFGNVEEEEKTPTTTIVAPEERYELQGSVGKGSYGAVYQAIDRQTGQKVAVKIVPSDGKDDAGLAELSKEIQLLKDCDHPNVVQYLDSFYHAGYLWIVMEFCGGGSVSDVMAAQDKPLTEQQIAYVCKETLLGLQYLHQLNRLHRDVKCGNIIFTDQGKVKLADLGIASQLTNTLSKRNTFIGTPHWMAPEVIQESRYDGRVDVWGLGISGIEMAETCPPRWKVHPMRVIFMISRDEPPTLTEPSQWSQEFRDFLHCCLQKEPKQRSTTAELLEHEFIRHVKAEEEVVESLLPSIRQYREALEKQMRSKKLVLPMGIFGHTMASTGRLSWRGTARAGGTHASGSTQGSSGRKPIPAELFARPEDVEGQSTMIEKTVKGGTVVAKKGRGNLGLAIKYMLGDTDGLADEEEFRDSLLEWYRGSTASCLPVKPLLNTDPSTYLGEDDFDFDSVVMDLLKPLLGAEGIELREEQLKQRAAERLKYGTMNNILRQFASLKAHLAQHNLPEKEILNLEQDIQNCWDMLSDALLA